MHFTTIIGNLGRDPEVRSTKNGGSVANLAVAVNEYRGKDKEVATYWYNVVAWGENAKVAEDLTKGDRVVVVGKMQTRKWEDKEGQTRYSTELVAEDWNGVVASAPAPRSDKKRGDDEDEAPRRKSASSGKKSYADDLDEIPFAWVLTIGIGSVIGILHGLGSYIA